MASLVFSLSNLDMTPRGGVRVPCNLTPYRPPVGAGLNLQGPADQEGGGTQILNGY